MTKKHKPDVVANLAANVARLLRERGWTQHELARLTGETDNTISRIVLAANSSNIAVLYRVSVAFGVSTDDLLSPQKRKKTAKSKKRG